MLITKNYNNSFESVKLMTQTIVSLFTGSSEDAQTADVAPYNAND